MARSKTKIGEWDDIETFTNLGAKLNRPYVGIRSNGIVTFSVGFVRQAKDHLEGKQYVQIYYSKANLAMIFEFTDDDSLEGVTKITGKEKVGLVIGVKSFFNYYHIDIEQVKGRHIPELVDIPGKGKLWVVYLDRKAQPLWKRRQARARRS